jgi:hypothetical protein
MKEYILKPIMVSQTLKGDMTVDKPVVKPASPRQGLPRAATPVGKAYGKGLGNNQKE